MVTASEITAVLTQLQQNPRDDDLRLGLINDAVNLISQAEPDLLQEHADEYVLIATQIRQHALLDTLLNKVGYKDEYMPWVENWDEGWSLLRSHANRVIVNETNNRDQINQEHNQLLSPPQSRSASPELEEFEARGASPPLQPASVDLPATLGVNQIPEAPLPEAFIRPTEFLYAIYSQQNDIVDAYIEKHGRNRIAMNFTDRRTGTGDNALLIAASTGNQEIIDKLIDTQMFDLTYSNHAGQNAAQIAEQSGHFDVAARLLALINDLQQRVDAAPSDRASQSSSAPTGTFAERLEKIGVDSSTIGEFFKCPFSHDIMTRPVVINGETFDKSSLEDAFRDPDEHSLRSPKGNIITRDSYEKADVCTAFRDAIESYVENLEKQHQPKTAAQAVGDAYQQQLEDLKQNSANSNDDDNPKPKGTFG